MTEKERVYRCWLNQTLGDAAAQFVDVPYEKGIVGCAEGFWVNAEWQYTQGSDCLHWIPPARLALVTKLEVNADGF